MVDVVSVQESRGEILLKIEGETKEGRVSDWSKPKVDGTPDGVG